MFHPVSLGALGPVQGLNPFRLILIMKPEFTWQGIGISSNPFQRDEPLSLHLLAYLREASGLPGYHVLMVADTMQETNYRALNKLGEYPARRIARAKGKQKARRLRKVCRASGLDNIGVCRFDRMFRRDQKKILSELEEAYRYDEETRERIQSLVPERLRNRAEDQDLLAQYALKEIALTLSLPGVKFGHEGEKPCDMAAKELHYRHGIGDEPRVRYSSLGMEFIPDRGLWVEPYSAIRSESRLLLTDSRRQFRKKLEKMGHEARETLREQLAGAWGGWLGSNEMALYENAVRPVYNEFVTKPRKGLWGAAAAAVLIGMVTVNAVRFEEDVQRLRQEIVVKAGAYGLEADANQIRQAKFNEIPVWYLTGPDVDLCQKRINEAIEEANKEIQEKWGIPNYFETGQG